MMKEEARALQPVKEEDLYAMRFLSDPRVSPDGKWAVYVESRADKEKNGYTRHLRLVNLETGKDQPLTGGKSDSAPRWLSDTKVMFTAGKDRTGAADGSSGEETNLYVIDVQGGEAELYRKVPLKLQEVHVLPDEALIGLHTADVSEEEKPQSLKDGEEEPLKAVRGKDYEAFDEVPFWFNARGIINKKRRQIARVNLDGSVGTLTGRFTDVIAWDLSPDKKKAAFVGRTYTDMEPRISGLYLLDLQSGKTMELVPQEKWSIGSVIFLDEDTLFYTALEDERRGLNSAYCLCHLENLKEDESGSGLEMGQAMDMLPFPDNDPMGGVGTDCLYGGGQKMKACGGNLYFTLNVRSQAVLVKMDRKGAVTAVDDKEGAVAAFDKEAGSTVVLAMRDMHLAELYRLDETTGEETPLTHRNDDYIASHRIEKPETFTMKDRDGVMLEGFVIKPAGFEKAAAGQTFPGVLEMHGGPKVAFGPVFHHEMQVLSSKGYFVFYTNPRGSSGRGDAFADINGKLGTVDYNDFMDFTDEVVKRYPALSEKKIGICGGSYGGFMCNWMIGHTHRFAAAASQRSISNYVTKLLCTDIGVPYNMPQIKADPWSDPEKVWEVSPLKYAPNADTPTLLIESDEDYRCYQSGAIQMFNALCENGTPARLAFFHGENHELSRSGKPQNRVLRLKEILGWFERYLKEKPAD